MCLLLVEWETAKIGTVPNCNIHYCPTSFQSTQCILDRDWENTILRK